MGNWRDAIPSKWLKASDFATPKLLTIKKFGVEKIGEEQLPCVWFNELEKGLVLNITNGNTVEDIVGTPDPDQWPGTVVVLYQTETDFGGKRVPCIRVRAPKPGTAAPEPQEYVVEDDVPF